MVINMFKKLSITNFIDKINPVRKILIERKRKQRTPKNNNMIIEKNGKTKPDMKFYKPGAVFFGIFIPLALCCFIQFILMMSHNFSNPKNQVGFFFDSGAFLVYVAIMVFGWFSVYKISHYILKGFWNTRNAPFIQGDLHVFENDASIKDIEDMIRDFNVAPDAGLGFDPSPSDSVTALVGHMFALNRGINKINIPVYDSGIDGYVKRDENGNIVYKKTSMFCKEFAEALYDASGVHVDDRFYYDTTEFDYNPIIKRKDGGDGKRRKFSARERGPYDKLSDVINNTFYTLDTDTQQPAGLYFYDSTASNTILIAITRAGKGQTYIEPMIDVQRRCKIKWNLLITDPKGELINKFYYSLTKSGYEVIQFNLLSDSLTNVFNPLINSILLFRQNDTLKGSTLVDALSNLIFPDDGEIWNKAAGNMFKRAVYTLFDYVIEQEKYLRYMALKNNIPNEVLTSQINKLYSKVTLFNIYSLISSLCGKITKDDKLLKVNPKAVPVAEKDLLSVLFDAVNTLPSNKLRELAIKADESIRPIGGAQQTLAGVYASLLTNMSIYIDPTTSALLSGSIEESFDVSGLGFPRRFGIELNKQFMEKYQYYGEIAEWSFYKDAKFTIPYEGKDFKHQEKIKKNNWIWCYWGGILDDIVSYAKLEIKTNGKVARTFYFKFIKGFKTVNNITYAIDEITGSKVIKDGFLVEIDPKTGKESLSKFNEKQVNFKTKTVDVVKSPIILSTQVFYTERPKVIFFIVPPNKQHYQKHPLMIIDQLFNGSLDLSYVIKNTTKPIVGTRTLFDEFGNISDNGKGIPNLDKIVSIGLGQNIQNTFVLQSFEQLRSLYGEEVENVVRSNSAITIFLKSNEKNLLDEMIRLSGVKHNIRVNSSNYQVKPTDLITVGEPTISYGKQQEESTTLVLNDLLFLAGDKPGNGIVFRSNDMPIVNKGAHITPCAWRLHSKLPNPKDGQYSQNNLPTTRATTFGTLEDNLIDAEQLVYDRVEQAKISLKIKDEVLKLHSDYNLSIKENNGDLSNYMMNMVYEEFDKQAEHLRMKDGNVKSYSEIANTLDKQMNILMNPNVKPEEKELVVLELRDLLFDLVDDEELENLTSIYRNTNSKENGAFIYAPGKVFQFITAMKREFPEEKRIEDLKVVDIYEEADKIEEYKRTFKPNIPLEYDFRNSYHLQILEDMVTDVVEKGVNIQDLSCVVKNPKERDVYIGGQLVAKQTHRDLDIFVTDVLVKPDELNDIVVNHKLLFNEIKRRLDSESEAKN